MTSNPRPIEWKADLFGQAFPSLDQALEVFYQIRGLERLRKKPSTSELVDWISMLLARSETSVELSPEMADLGTLLKKEQDLEVFADYTSGRSNRPRIR